MRPHLQYTLSHFEPSSTIKTWINCNKINGAPPLHGRNLSTCAVRRGCRSWACTAWRRNGFCGTQEQPARADREIIEKTNSSLMVVGGQETPSLSWGSDISETLFHQNHSNSSPSLKIYKARHVRSQSNFIWPWSWSCFELEAELDTLPELPSDTYEITKLWKQSQINIQIDKLHIDLTCMMGN